MTDDLETRLLSPRDPATPAEREANELPPLAAPAFGITMSLFAYLAAKGTLRWIRGEEDTIDSVGAFVGAFGSGMASYIIAADRMGPRGGSRYY
jgi:hypothetical protein